MSGRGLCDELITRPVESYGLCCVVVCDLETSRIGAPYIYEICSLRLKLLPRNLPGGREKSYEKTLIRAAGVRADESQTYQKQSRKATQVTMTFGVMQ